MEHLDERPGERAMWERLHRLWIVHAAELRCVLGEEPARSMLDEAHQMLPSLPGRRAVLLTLRRPTAGPSADAAADTMSELGRQSGGHTNPGRTPQ
ncbi:hypothetical protein ABZ599_15685 [Streptomyces misionensis]|uniref:hypothetical protein n=1 Tax=Streptomyces misionensis TaxID=67331 RepID=UPI0034068E74